MRKAEENKIEGLIEAKEYSKSNFIIGAKYKSNLLESQVTALSLSRIQYDEQGIYAEIKANELMKLLNINNKSFYRKLDTVAKCMTGRAIGMSDPENQEFDYIAVITRATYKRGTLTIKFNNDLKDYIVNIKSNFTLLNLPIMLSFENVFAFRLYEILKSKMYKTNTYRVKVSELRFLLGVADAEEDKVRGMLKGHRSPNYDKALEKAENKMYIDYNDFRTNVVDKAIEDINNKSDISVEYDPIRSSHGKVEELVFNFQLKESVETQTENIVDDEEDNKLDVIEQVLTMAEGRIKLKEANSIAKAADFDLERIKAGYAIIENYKGKITNVVGLWINAIKEEYKLMPQDKPVKNSFNNFQQQAFDFENFEEQILAN